MSVARDIESRIDIVELASRYVVLKKAGANYKGLSPFKAERTPSFVVSPAKNLAYCFATHRGGWPIKFLMEIEQIPYSEALALLAKEAGVELRTNFQKRERDAGGDVYDLHRASKEYYHTRLWEQTHADKLKYLRDRGLSDETIQRFELGYADSGKPHYEHLRAKWFGEKMILESGIFSAKNRDKFTGRVIFPLANFTGHTIGFTGRIIDRGEPKYLNSPASEIFDKSRLLYGLHLAKSTITKHDRIVIVEGQMDTIALHQAGYAEAVGISGSALTREQIQSIKRLTRNIFLCLDSDSAGVAATFSTIENTLGEEVNLSIITLPDAKDPDEFLKSGGDFEARIRDAQSHIAFFIAHANKKINTNTLSGKTQIVRELLPMLKKLANSVERDVHIRQIAETLGISIESVYEELKKYRGKPVSARDEPVHAFDLHELITGYLGSYGYFDLFFANFAYNLENLQEWASALTLRRMLSAGESWGDDDALDHDSVAGVSLFVEEENTGTNDESRKQKFLALVHRLNHTLFEQERTELIARMDSPDESGPDTLMSEYDALLRRGKSLGLLR